MSPSRSPQPFRVPRRSAPRAGRAAALARPFLGASALVLAATVLPAPATSQKLDVTGYALGVAVASGSSALVPSGTTLLGRARIMPKFTDGPFTVDVAYEHVLQRTPAGGGFAITSPGGTTGGSSDWMGLDWTIRSTSRSDWRQRFDRLNVSVNAGPLAVTVGRQAISWATTLILTPADPFAPFSPSDPFREYLGGVDAVRVQTFPGPFSEVEAVVRGADTPDGRTLTALARAQTSRGGWAVGAWGGILHDQNAGAVFATGAVRATGVRMAAAIRRAPSGGGTVRAAVGVDERFTVYGRDLYAVVEVQYDGFGASDAAGLLAAATSAPYGRGEMQVLGRWETATQVRYQIHPLVSVDVLALGNLDDGSVLVAPGLTWSATASMSVRAGAFSGMGRGGLTLSGPRSEYGEVPRLGYLAVSWFF
jgi:hypothetical protein